MSVLTTSQLTFCDLRDSYNINIDTEYIGITCNSDGTVVEQTDITIQYYASIGAERIGASCTISNLPDGVTVVDKTSSSKTTNGIIVFSVAKNANLGNDFTSSAKVTFITSDSEGFTFEKYITFIKSLPGADGTDAVDFQIYSVDGFEFSDTLSEITLQTIALQAGIKINDSDVTYQWQWWNSSSSQYENISGGTSSTLTIDIDNDEYALCSIRCEMLYDGITYTDTVSLTKKTSIYDARINFHDGNNIVTSDEDYLIAYVELYKDNSIEEELKTSEVYIHQNNKTVVKSWSADIVWNMISTNLSGTYKDGDMRYFVCRNIIDKETEQIIDFTTVNVTNKQTGTTVNETDSTKIDINAVVIKDKTTNKIINTAYEYDVVLGRYTIDSNRSGWKVIPSDYIYRNNVFKNTTSPIVYIPKEKISRVLTIRFDICTTNNIVVTQATTNVFDFNDPAIGANEPSDPSIGQLWLDQSVSPSILKMWDGAQWVNSSYQNGNVVFTSKPDKYSKGDLWILSDDDGNYFPQFGTGAIVRATSDSSSFNINHWEDAMDGIITNMRESFTWDKTGIRIAKKYIDSVGGSTTPFYVHIDSTRMGFHSVTYDTNGSVDADVEVVHIGNNSATIQNAIFTGNNGTVFNNNTTFNQQMQLGKFIFKTESDGSLSLALAN